MRFLKVQNYDFNKQLTKDFTLGELVQSDTAYNQKLYMQYVEQRRIVENLTILAQQLLQPLRDQLGAPINITSGYRCSALNSLVGGSPSSLHISGFAADIASYGRHLSIAKIMPHMQFHECIIHRTYIHVSFKEMGNDFRYRNLTGDSRYDGLF